MKKIVSFLCVGTIMLLTACFSDDSSMATDDSRVQAIQIEGIKDTSMVAYAEPLELTADVQGFKEEELSYAWYIYGGQFGETLDNGYRTHKIGAGRILSYPIELKIGVYTVVCEVTHQASGYFVTSTFNLNVTSDFSEGFYVLKETADGNTELDFYNHLKKTFNPNLLDKVHGASLTGKPRNLGMVYQKIYMDPETAESTYGTGIFVGAGENGFAMYNTTDMSLMFDRTNFHFEEMGTDEIPYAMHSFGQYNFYFSSLGLNTEMLGGLSYSMSTGQSPLPEGIGGSTFIQPIANGVLAYWSESEHRLVRVSEDWSGTLYGDITYPEDYAGKRIDWEQAIPVASGWNYIAGENTIWFMFDVASEGRYLVLVKGRNISEVRLLDSSLNIAKSEVIAGRGVKNNVIYSASGSKLYRYSVIEGTENEMTASALPSGEITYVENLFFKNKKWDYLVIGVQDGSKYTVGMYNIEGGQPYGTPEHTFEGEGKVKKVNYAFPPNTMYTVNAGPFGRYSSDPDFPY